jgi:hypothetical protein
MNIISKLLQKNSLLPVYTLSMRTIFIVFCSILCCGSMVFANNSFQIIPEAENSTKADEVSKGLIEIKTDEDFWDKYNSGADNLKLGDQIRS